MQNETIWAAIISTGFTFITLVWGWLARRNSHRTNENRIHATKHLAVEEMHLKALDRQSEGWAKLLEALQEENKQLREDLESMRSELHATREELRMAKLRIRQLEIAMESNHPLESDG